MIFSITLRHILLQHFENPCCNFCFSARGRCHFTITDQTFDSSAGIAKDNLLILAFITANFNKFTFCVSHHTNSTFLALMPCGCELILLHTVQVYRKSVFLVALAPVLLNLVTAGLE